MASDDVTALERLCAPARELVLGTPLQDDMERLLQLSLLAPDEQRRILLAHLHIGVTWETMIGTARAPSTLRRRLGNVGDTIVVNVGELRPNTVNCTIFAESLSNEGIEPLVEDIARRSQRVPIEILADGEIIGGERRWLAATKSNDKTILATIIAESMTESEIRAYIHDAHATARDASIGERVRVFQNAVTVLKERHGRPSGRPKASSFDQGLAGSQIRELAAKHAGFPSEATARRAARVLKEGSDEIKKGLLNGTLSIYAAYAMLCGDKEPEPDESDDLAPPSSPARALPAGAENPIKRLPPASSPHALGGQGDKSGTSPLPPEEQTGTSAGLPAPPVGLGNEDASGEAAETNVPGGANPGVSPPSNRRTRENGAATSSSRPKTTPQRRSRVATSSSKVRLAYERGMVGVLAYFAHLHDNDPDKAAPARIDHIAQIDAVLGNPTVDDGGATNIGADLDDEANGEVDLNVESEPSGPNELQSDLDEDNQREDDSNEDDPSEADPDESDPDQDDSAEADPDDSDPDGDNEDENDLEEDDLDESDADEGDPDLAELEKDLGLKLPKRKR